MQTLASLRQDYLDGALESDPLAAMQCDWHREQANPSLDFVDSDPVVDLVDAQYLLALGVNGGVVPRWQELPESAKINHEAAWRLHCWGGSCTLAGLDTGSALDLT